MQAYVSEAQFWIRFERWIGFQEQFAKDYYYEELTLKEISKVLEVSESRVSQLHTKALLKMRKKMGPYMNILTGR